MGERFTAAEDDLIQNQSHKEACRALPHRKPNVIATRRYMLKNRQREQGKKLGKFTSDEAALLRIHYAAMSNIELQKQHFPDRSIGCLIRKARYMGLRKKFEAVPGLPGHDQLVEQIINVARNRGIATYWLDRFCGTGRYFTGEWRKCPLNLAAVVRAVELIGGRLRFESDQKPFGEESRRLVACLARFGREAVQKVAKSSTQQQKLKPVVLRPNADAQIRNAVSALLPNREGREDVLQMIMVSFYEGRITVDDLVRNRKLIGEFFRSYMRNNFEGSGYSLSLDEPTRDGRSRYDTLKAPDDWQSDHGDEGTNKSPGRRPKKAA